jgi:single-strand DNA-binding protein
MRNLNRSEFIGHLGSKEFRVTKKGTSLFSASLAVKGERKNAQGEKEEHTTWVQLSIYGRLGELAEKYVKVGDKLYVAGKYRVLHWTDIQTGKEIYKSDFMITEMEMLSQKNQPPQPEQVKPLGDYLDNEFSEVNF